jgi:hypothetical protein
VQKFIEPTPDVVGSYLEQTIGDKLRGHVYHSSSSRRVAWGVLAEPAPDFYFNVFEPYLRKNDRFQGQVGLSFHFPTSPTAQGGFNH